MLFFIHNNDVTDPRINLALEEYCLRHLEPRHDYLIFYINEPAVIIGRNQNTIEEINPEYVRRTGIHIVRRISGGGAVYHDHGNLNFSFITRYDRSNVLNFRKFTEPVIRALQQIGVAAELTGRNDIVAYGRKISGNAQYSTTRNMFSHGTLLFDSHLDAVSKALNVTMDKIESKGIKSVRSRVANISDYLENNLDMQTFRNYLLSMIFEPYGGLKEYRLSNHDWDNIHRLSKEKYQSWDWNYGHSPQFNIQKKRRFDIGQIDTRIHVKTGVIQDIKIYGDFLGHGDIRDVENRLKGIRYHGDDIRKCLQDADLKHYFGDITLDMISDYLC